MKKITCIILFFLIIFTVSGCRNVDKDKIEYTLSDDGTYYILSYIGANVENLVIPEYYNEKPVLEIGNYACCHKSGPLHNDSKIKSVQIEANLTKIGNAAFQECIFLETINIPSTVTEIGAGAFSMCESLGSIEIPSGVTQINRSLFNRCKELESISFHNRITKIDAFAFFGCNSIAKVTLPEGIEFIGDYAFSMMENLEEIKIAEENKNFVSIDGILYSKDKKTLIQYVPKNECESYIIPEGVKTISGYAFAGNSKIKSISIPDRATLPSLHPQNNYCTL